MPVHFAGLSMDMDALYQFARARGLRVIEDAAHAIGSRWDGRRLGSFGDIVSFSFHPNKNMTSIEGGALSLVSPDEARQVERWRYHGITRGTDGSMDVLHPGGKFNLPDVNATLGLRQLQRLEEFNARRRDLVERYFSALVTDPPCALPARGEGHSWHIFAPLLPLQQLRLSRAEFIEAMRERGIGVGIHYPALHLFSLYRDLGYAPGDFPNAERIGAQTVTLPLFPAMTLRDVDRVCAAIAEIFALHRLAA
jgi:dTDP-4-amino-4,6-dideoxygalactose transaminase